MSCLVKILSRKSLAASPAVRAAEYLANHVAVNAASEITVALAVF